MLLTVSKSRRNTMRVPNTMHINTGSRLHQAKM